jgi:predicted permease
MLAMVVMMILSYIWHGIVLNDFKNMSLAMPVFIILSSIVYFLISLVINFILFKIEFHDHHTTKRFLLGGLIGFSIYLIVFILGLSYGERGMKHIISDFGWQMFEQGIGALIVDFCLHIYQRMDKFETSEE